MMDAFEQIETAIDLEKLMKKAALKPRDLYILQSRFGFKRPFSTRGDIAHVCGISVPRVAQLEAKIIKRLRKVWP